MRSPSLVGASALSDASTPVTIEPPSCLYGQPNCFDAHLSMQLRAILLSMSMVSCALFFSWGALACHGIINDPDAPCSRVMLCML